MRAPPGVTGSANNPLHLGPDEYTSTAAANPDVTFVMRDGHILYELPATGGGGIALVVYLVVIVLGVVAVGAWIGSAWLLIRSLFMPRNEGLKFHLRDDARVSLEAGAITVVAGCFVYVLAFALGVI